METFFEWCWIYLIYSFLGWITEVAYAAVNQGKFVNRGFLNGPVCPIYGAGVAAVIFILTPLKKNFFLLFLGAVIVTSLIEFLTGFVLEKIFKNKWWDYSKEPFNVKGYICLKFSLLWGFACVLVVNNVHPMIEHVIECLQNSLGTAFLILFFIIMLIDMADTVSNILKLNRRLYALEEIAESLRKVSCEIGENVAEGALDVVELGTELKERRETFVNDFRNEVLEKREEYVKLMEKYETLLREKARENRLLKAFPGLKSEKWQASFMVLRDAVKEISEKNRKARKQ